MFHLALDDTFRKFAERSCLAGRTVAGTAARCSCLRDASGVTQCGNQGHGRRVRWHRKSQNRSYWVFTAPDGPVMSCSSLSQKVRWRSCVRPAFCVVSATSPGACATKKYARYSLMVRTASRCCGEELVTLTCLRSIVNSPPPKKSLCSQNSHPSVAPIAQPVAKIHQSSER